MGNKQSTQEEQHKIRFKLMFNNNYEICEERINQAFGSVWLCRNKNTNEIEIMIKELFDQVQDSRMIIESMQERIAFPLPNLLNIYHLQITESICNSQKVIKVYFEYVKKSLKEELKKRFKLQYYFSEDQLWKILISLVNAIKSLHERNIFHMEISFENVLINDNYQLKLIEKSLLDSISWVLDFNTGFFKLIKGKGVLFSPYIIKCFANNFSQLVISDAFKGDVFAVGMILLECASLKHSTDFYDYQNFTMNMEGINDRIFQLRKKYNFQFINMIRQMLEEKDDERPSSSQFYEKIKNIPNEMIKQLNLALNESLFDTIKSKSSL